MEARRKRRGEGEASDNEGKKKKTLQEASERGRRECTRKKGGGDAIEIADINPFSLPSRR